MFGFSLLKVSIFGFYADANSIIAAGSTRSGGNFFLDPRIALGLQFQRQFLTA
jgi:hypothetical protein